ncbi:MAG TPA: AAA family ATPase [Blastocatellia bacterium]|nr:AAA family ATPase [Blastocatellia bacterium]
MLITRVELENIKNYESGEFEFGPGVTAICGPNGAGKTTILEAIAWALFDQLPYKKEDFLRRGSKKGAVRVTFRSTIDEREYTVYRDTGAGYYVYDPVTKMRVVEQKSQVAAWLKAHLGVEPGTDLKTLFTSTIGVPQGTFTVDFADQPSRRKVGFDKVLRVDEYQRSSDELRDLTKLMQQRDTALREDIARVEVEVERLDGLQEELAHAQQQVRDLGQRLSEGERDLERARARLAQLDELRNRIERLGSDAAALSARIQETERRHVAIVEDVTSSRKAAEAVSAATAGYNVYNEAQAALAELDEQKSRREAIRKELAEREREQVRIDADLRNQREKLAQLEADRAEIARLAARVAEQEELEKRRGELHKLLGQLDALLAQKDRAQRDLDALRTEYARITKQIDEAEKLKDLAESAPRLEVERQQAEARLSEMRLDFQRLNERRKESKRVREAIATLTVEVKTLEREIAEGASAERMADLLPQLEAEAQSVTEEVYRLKAAIEREQKLLDRIQDGLCPLLSQKCLNMKDGQGLDQYFHAQLGDDRQRLARLDRKQKEIQAQVEAAREAFKKSSGIASQRAMLARREEELELKREEAANLEKEIAQITVTEQAIRSFTAEFESLQRNLKAAQNARITYEGLGALRAHHESLKSEGSQKRKAFDELVEKIAALSGARDELDQVNERLSLLDDPRGRVNALRKGLEKEAEIHETITAFEAEAQEIANRITGLHDRLTPFNELDERIAAAQTRRAMSERDYRLYLDNQPIAALLESRETELNAVEKELEERRDRLARIEEELAEALSLYDEQEQIQLRAKAEELINITAALAADLLTANARVEELTREIDRLLAARERLAELVWKRDRYAEMLNFSDFVRDLLKKAGPHITEAHLQSISIEANQLYREIAGNPMVSLRWDSGYEIILEEEGHERPFASLSGGEQMAAALAVRLALLKELAEIRIAFFDEPTTNMDEDRRRNLAQQIGRIKDFDQLFVISHDDTFEGFTDRVISVRGVADRA